MSNPNDDDNDDMPNPHLDTSEPTGDYPVGYRRPPAETQFKKGRSGNPKGRPKGSRNVAATLSRLADEQISVRYGDEVRKVSRADALLISLFQRALKGDHRAAAKLLQMLHQYGFAKTPEEAQVGGVLRVDRPCLTSTEWIARHGADGLRTIEQIDAHQRDMLAACELQREEIRKSQAWAIEVKKRWGGIMRDLPPEYRDPPSDKK